ncbi:CAP domain-containing protein [Nocardioides daeguensis]|uniref:CAP domain-containing protein n=1 Tax=Nocardioides daeguensis TaxID=908359 RepID=UPI001C47ED0F|nr:CAP domain-containing protein [Nocardioides daeguensis]MBV6727927.1 CAP domain-containing protein [Nocardioides daeguensis]MCR1771670.1 CAP domain-containing protein [Nocardioides daeguensis]
MRSVLLPGAVLATVVLTMAPASSHPAPAPRPAPRIDTARVEVQLLDRVNVVRRQAGCRRLRPKAGLHGAAAAHSAAMGATGTLSHQLPGEPVLRDRVAAAGFRNAARMGEVIARGPTSARSALDRWLDSPPHRAVLLDCRLRLVGLGVESVGEQLWWTVDLVRC